MNLVLLVSLIFAWAQASECTNSESQLTAEGITKIKSILSTEVSQKLPEGMKLKELNLKFSPNPPRGQNSDKTELFYELLSSNATIVKDNEEVAYGLTPSDLVFKVTLWNDIREERKWPLGPIKRRFCVVVIPYSIHKLSLVRKKDQEPLLDNIFYAPRFKDTILEIDI